MDIGQVYPIGDPQLCHKAGSGSGAWSTGLTWQQVQSCDQVDVSFLVAKGTSGSQECPHAKSRVKSIRVKL